MQDFEKKTHLKTHANTKYGAQDQLVPYRNIEKRQSYSGDDIFIYCGVCGLDLHSVGTSEQML